MNDTFSSNFLWVEKYRPHKIADTILPNDLKNTFTKFVEQGQIPNIILSGTSGIGKTTVARAMLDELNADYIFINGSLNAGIDTLRNDIAQYASSYSLKGGRKYCLLDEADFLGAHVQGALRNFMEEYSNACGFILTCNYKNKIIEPLHSRCSVIDFTYKKSDIPKLASQFLKRITYILQNENVKYNKEVLVALIEKFFPDWRRIINELQRYSVNGEIDTGILSNITDINIKELMVLLKNKKFEDIRKWVHEHNDRDSTEFFHSFYKCADEYLVKRSIPLLILKIADYQYKASFVADKEINTLAFLIEVMMECEFL